MLQILTVLQLLSASLIIIKFKNIYSLLLRIILHPVTWIVCWVILVGLAFYFVLRVSGYFLALAGARAITGVATETVVKSVGEEVRKEVLAATSPAGAPSCVWAIARGVWAVGNFLVYHLRLQGVVHDALASRGKPKFAKLPTISDMPLPNYNSGCERFDFDDLYPLAMLVGLGMCWVVLGNHIYWAYTLSRPLTVQKDGTSRPRVSTPLKSVSSERVRGRPVPTLESTSSGRVKGTPVPVLESIPSEEVRVRPTPVLEFIPSGRVERSIIPTSSESASRGRNEPASSEPVSKVRKEIDAAIKSATRAFYRVTLSYLLGFASRDETVGWIKDLCKNLSQVPNGSLLVRSVLSKLGPIGGSVVLPALGIPIKPMSESDKKKVAGIKDLGDYLRSSGISTRTAEILERGYGGSVTNNPTSPQESFWVQLAALTNSLLGK